MCKFNKNNNYSVKDISAALLEKFPGYFKNEAACIATIGPWIRRNNITPVNGQKNHRVFSGLDAQRVFDHEAEIIKAREVPAKRTKSKVNIAVKVNGQTLATTKADPEKLTPCAGQMSLFDDGGPLAVAIDDKTVINLSPKYAAYLRAMVKVYKGGHVFPIIKDEQKALEMIIRQHAENYPSILFKMFDFDFDAEV